MTRLALDAVSVVRALVRVSNYGAIVVLYCLQIHFTTGAIVNTMCVHQAVWGAGKAAHAIPCSA